MKTGIEIIAERESKAFTANGMSREELRRPPGGGGTPAHVQTVLQRAPVVEVNMFRIKSKY